MDLQPFCFSTSDDAWYDCSFFHHLESLIEWKLWHKSNEQNLHVKYWIGDVFIVRYLRHFHTWNLSKHKQSFEPIQITTLISFVKTLTWLVIARQAKLSSILCICIFGLLFGTDFGHFYWSWDPKLSFCHWDFAWTQYLISFCYKQLGSIF